VTPITPLWDACGKQPDVTLQPLAGSLIAVSEGGWPRSQDVAPAQKMGGPGLAFETWDGRISAPDPVRHPPQALRPLYKGMGLTNAPAPRSPPQPGCPTLAASLFLRLGWGWPKAPGCQGAPGLAFETWDGRISAPDPVRQTPKLFAPFTKGMGLTNAPAPRSPPQPGCPTLAASLFLRLGWGWPKAQPHRSPQPGAPPSRVDHNLAMHKIQNDRPPRPSHWGAWETTDLNRAGGPAKPLAN